MSEKSLHIISNGKQKPKEFIDIAYLIKDYVSYFHIREKTLTAIELVEIVNLLVSKGIPLSKIIINDRVDVAAVMETQGVQITHHSLPVQLVKRNFPSLTVGCSVHSIDELEKAQKAGADYVLYGHIYETNSKPGLPSKGIIGLKDIIKNSSIPVIAIGGIKPIHVPELIQEGASGVAVMSGVLEASDPLKVVKEYMTQLHQGG